MLSIEELAARAAFCDRKIAEMERLASKAGDNDSKIGYAKLADRWRYLADYYRQVSGVPTHA